MMGASEVFHVKTKCKSITNVLNGQYPAIAVTKMNSGALQKFVGVLLQCTADILGAKKFEENIQGKPYWWLKEVGFNTWKQNSTNSLTKRMTLIQLVVKCSEFFRSFPISEKTFYKNVFNDENCENVIKVNGVKRKRVTRSTVPNKKRKTLAAKNAIDIKPSPVPIVCLKDILKTPPQPQTSTKEDYMSYFRLENTCTKMLNKEPALPYQNPIRLLHYPQIPISSDVGRILIKGKCSMPEELQLKKLEKLEWYVNKPPVKQIMDQDYKVTFVPKNNNNCHEFKFPLRQYRKKCESLLKYCKPLRVKLEKLDQEQLDKIKNKQVKVVVQRLSLDDSLHNNNNVRCNAKNGEIRILRSSKRRLASV